MGLNKPVLFAVLLMVSNCAASRPPTAPGQDPGLADCPDRPNCVSSLAADEKHQVAPLTFSGSQAEAATRLVSVLEQMKGSKIVSQTDTAIRAEFTSTVFRFVDDVDFSFDAAHHRIDLRSASRVGYFDFGANRRRVAEIRRRFEAASLSPAQPAK
ncbi:MAG: DUF1499 domain-containing protein [Desulfobacterales bacterium]